MVLAAFCMLIANYHESKPVNVYFSTDPRNLANIAVDSTRVLLDVAYDSVSRTTFEFVAKSKGSLIRAWRSPGSIVGIWSLPDRLEPSSVLYSRNGVIRLRAIERDRSIGQSASKRKEVSTILHVVEVSLLQNGEITVRDFAQNEVDQLRKSETNQLVISALQKIGFTLPVTGPMSGHAKNPTSVVDVIAPTIGAHPIAWDRSLKSFAYAYRSARKSTAAIRGTDGKLILWELESVIGKEVSKERGPRSISVDSLDVSPNVVAVGVQIQSDIRQDFIVLWIDIRGAHPAVFRRQSGLLARTLQAYDPTNDL